MIPRVTGKCFFRSSTTRSSSRRLPLAGRAASAEPSLARLRHHAPGSFVRLAVLRLLVEVARAAGGSARRDRQRAAAPVLQTVDHVRAARMEPAAARRIEQRRRLARDLHEPLDVRRRGAAASRAGPRCTGGAARLKSSSTGACSATCAAYMTTTSSAISATTPRSCVIMMIALPKSSCSLSHQLEDLRLRRHVERRRRLVGDQQVGVVDERHRDHHALAHAARELVRVVVDPALGARDADRLQQLERARPARLASTRPGGGGSPRRAARRSCAPGSATSSDPGRSSRCRCRGSRAARLGLVVSRSSPLKRASPVVIVSRFGVQAHDRQAGDALAASRTRRRCRASCPSRPEADAVDRLDDAVVGRKWVLKVAGPRAAPSASGEPDAWVDQA